MLPLPRIVRGVHERDLAVPVQPEDAFAGRVQDELVSTTQALDGFLGALAIGIPLGIVLGSSRLLYRAGRVSIEFLRPIPSAALIPLLFLTLGTTLQSEVFLATFGAFWPLLVQTIYGVRDVDPVAIDTARSFGVGRFERLYRIKLPSAIPYIATGLRISSAVALILAFTAELFMGTSGLGQIMNVAESFGLNVQVYALALATGFLGLAIYVVFSAIALSHPYILILRNEFN